MKSILNPYKYFILLALYSVLSGQQLLAQSVVHVSDASGVNVNTCGSPGSPCLTIQYAVDTIALDGDTIKIDTGLYQLASSVNQYIPVVKIPEGKSLSFIGTPMGLGTRIDGDTTRRGFLYYYAGTGCQTGYANDGIDDTLRFYFKDLIVQNCHIKETCGNVTYAYGGGMRLDCDSASEMYVNIEDCIFRYNRSYDIPGSYANGRSGSGGAIFIYGRRNANSTGPSDYAEAFIKNCDFTGNYANHFYNGGHGGAVLLRDLDTAAVVNSSFCDNYVYSGSADNGDLQHDRNAGGAICFYDLTSSNPGHGYHIDSCTFINNSALAAGNFFYKSEGGAVFLTKGDVLTATSSATLHISSSNFYGNIVETGIEHIDKNGGFLDTTSIGYNQLYDQFEVGLGNDTSFCAGDTLVLDASIPGASYLWQDGSTGPTYNVTQPDTYMVTVTVGTCSVSDTIVVDVIPYPVVNLGADTTLCPYDSLNLNVATVGASYLWSNNTIDSVLTINGGGTYWVEVDVNNCISSDTIVVDTVAINEVNLGPDTLLCDNAILNLNAQQLGASYLWQNGNTLSSFNVVNPGTFWVNVSIGPCIVSDTISVTYGNTPIVNLGPDQTICPYDSILLDAQVNGATYLWSNGLTTSSIIVYSENEYWVEVDNSGCVGTDTIFIDTVTLAPVNLGPDTQLCDNQILTLNAFQSGATYLWQDGSTNPNFNVVQAGFYAVTVTKSNCSYSDAISIAYQSYPVVELGADTTICPYDAIPLNAINAGAQYLWSTGATTPIISVSDEGNYSVSVNLNGCWSFDDIDIDTAVIPSSYLGPNQLLCPNDVFTLNATTNQAIGYLWQNGSTLPTFNGSIGGLYWVEVTVDVCAVRDSIQVNYVEPPADIIGGDVSICEDQSVTLSIWPTGLANFQWSNGSNQQSILVNTGGTYWAHVTKQGCPFGDTVDVEFRPLPIVDFGPDRDACEGDSVILKAVNPNALYVWNNGSTSSSKKVKKTGTYSVSVYMDGCFAEDHIFIEFKPNPVPELLNDVTVCEKQSHTFNAYRKSFDAYIWNTGSTDSAILVDAAGMYKVTVWMDGCSGSDSVQFIQLPLPEINLGHDSVFCEGDEIILDAAVDGVATYQWQDKSKSSTYTVWRPGGYSVRVERAGCVSRDTINFHMEAYPKLNLGNDTTICIGDSVVFNLDDSNSTFIWNGEEEKFKHVVNDSAYIWVVGSNYCGTIRDSVTVTIRDCECFMYVPLAFSPDDDGLNDILLPQFDCDISNYQMRLFDRWGELIFETDDPYYGWNGKRTNLPVKIGVYVFEVFYDAQLEVNGSAVHFEKTGTVQVLR